MKETEANATREAKTKQENSDGAEVPEASAYCPHHFMLTVQQFFGFLKLILLLYFARQIQVGSFCRLQPGVLDNINATWPELNWTACSF